MTKGIEETDPVCGADLEAGRTVTSGQYEGILYRFCCEGCRGKFYENPDRYLSDMKYRHLVYG